PKFLRMHFGDFTSLTRNNFFQPIHFVGRLCQTPSDYRRFTETPYNFAMIPRTDVIVHDGNEKGTSQSRNTATQLARPSLARMGGGESPADRTRIRAADTRTLEQ